MIVLLARTAQLLDYAAQSRPDGSRLSKQNAISNRVVGREESRCPEMPQQRR